MPPLSVRRQQLRTTVVAAVHCRRCAALRPQPSHPRPPHSMPRRSQLLPQGDDLSRISALSQVSSVPSAHPAGAAVPAAAAGAPEQQD